MHLKEPFQEMKEILTSELKRLKQNGFLENFNTAEVEVQSFQPPMPKFSTSPLKESAPLLALRLEEEKCYYEEEEKVESPEISSDFLGNPLEFEKLTFSQSRKAYKSQHTVLAPLPRKISRYFLNHLSKQIDEPLWALVDKMHLLGTFKNFRVSLLNSGPIKAKSDMQILKNLREQLAEGFSPPSPKIEEHCYATYHLEGVKLECSWHNVETILETPRQHGSSRLVVDLECLDKVLLSPFHKELLLLQSLSLALREGHPVAWQSSEMALSKVKEFIESGSTSQPSGGNSDMSLESVLEAILLGSHRELDFTDYLWNLLKGCSSADDLIMSLFYAMKHIQNGDSHPLFSRSNQTLIAKWFRGLTPDSAAVEIMESQYAMKALLEIGVLKLQRNFISAFKELELASHQMLEPYLSSSEDKTSDKTLSSLVTCFHILELGVRCIKLVHLPQDTVAGIVRQNLMLWKDSMPDPPFIIDVPITFVRSMLKPILPQEWTLVLKCKDDSNYVKEICYSLSRSSLWASMGFQEETLDPGSYYSTTMTCIQDPTFPVSKP